MLSKKSKSRSSAQARSKASPFIRALEQRLMFDGAAVASAADAAPSDPAPHDVGIADPNPLVHEFQAAAMAPAEDQSARRDVIFVDSRIQDAQQLLQDVASGTEIVYLNGQQDGLEQMTDYLAQHPLATSVQIIAHGNSGDLWLGTTYLSADNIGNFAGALSALGAELTSDGDILIYACNTAEGERGLAFVDSLAALTGRDVGASDDRTGASGDWNLEISVGSIETVPGLSATAQAAYQHNLATITVTSNADSGAGTLRQAIAGAINGDIITFSSSMTISLTTVTSGNMLAISKNLTIDGDLNNDGTADVTLNAQNRGRVLAVSGGATVTLDGIVLTNGLVSGNGGGFGGTIGGDAFGAGLHVSGAGTKVTVLGSTITANAAAGGGGGGSGGTYSYGGGGGGGRSSIGGGSGGAYNGGISGGTATNGIGGIGGYSTTAAQAGKGGSTTGGAGGSSAGGFVIGGAGATAGPGGGSSIGGGGGGAGASGGATGGRGGHAAGGMYVGSGAFLYMARSTVSSNWGAGGGGGGGYQTAGGAGGDGAGAVRVIGTFKYQSTSMTFSNNSGVGGGGGGSDVGNGGVAGSNGNSSNNIRSLGTVDSNWSPPNTVPTLGTVTANAVGQANAGQNSYSFTVVYSDSDGTIDNTTIDTNDVTVSKGGTFLTVANASWNAGTNTATYTVTPDGGTWNDADNGTWTVGIVANQVADNGGAFVAANASAGSFAVSMDTTGPTVSSVSSSSTNGSYKAGDTVTVTVQFNESVTVTGTPTLTLNSGGTASYASGSGTNTLTFSYTIQGGENASDLDYSATNSLALSGGTIRDAASNNATLTLPAVGGGSSLGGQKNIVVDTTASTISSVSASTANGTYKVGDTIAITVTFAEAVMVTGTPALTLNSGGSASYASGSGSNTLTFNYTIGAGDSAVDLDYSATNSLALSGGTIKDIAGNNATLTLPTVGGGSSLGGQKNLVIDGVAPTLQSDIVPANATYGTGQNLDFTVTYSEAVTVNTGGGTPYIGLTLNTGGAVQAAYVSGSGTTTLTFRYTVASGNVDGDGVAAATSITLNGSTIRDAAGNNAATTGITFASTASVLVEAVAPTVSSINRVSSAATNATSVNYTVTFSENVSGVDTSDFTLTSTGTATGTIASVSQVNGSTYTVTVNTITGVGTLRLDLKNAGTGIADTPGNAITTGFTSGQTYTIDNTAPAVTSVGVPANATYLAGQNLDFTVNFNENVTVNTGGGTPRIALTLDTGGTVYASYLAGSGTTALVFRYTVPSGVADTNGISVAGGIDANGGTLRDSATNNATLTLNSVGSTAGVLVDAIAPTVNSVSVPANTTYVAGQNLDFTVNFSENVTVNTGGGTPYIGVTLDTGGTVNASYVSGSGTSALLFRYTVVGGNLDSNGIALAGSITANGGTLRDGIGNDATLTLNSVGSTTSVLVDAAAPTVNSVSVPANSSYVAGQSLDFTVNFNESVTIDTTGGTPYIGVTLDTGGAVQASYLSGSGTSSIVFRYVVASGNLDTNGIALAGSITANGGTVRDAATNNANLTLNSVGSTASVFVDAIVPTVNSVSVPANGTYLAGQNLDFTVNFSENITVNTTGGMPYVNVTLDTGGTVQASYLSGSGTNALVFRYTVASGTLDSNGIALAGSITANGGTLRDNAANNANLTLNSVGSTAGVFVDAIAPTVSSVSVPANATYVGGQNLDFTVNFSENVTVNTGGGTPYIGVTLDIGGTVNASYVSGSGTSALLFRYTVAGGNGDGNGIGVAGVITANGGTLRDAIGNDATLTLNGVGSTASVLVDTTAPSVASINRVSATPTNATSVDYTVTFSENVGGVDMSDFALTSTGTAAGTISSVSAANGSTYTVTVSNISGDGTLRMDLKNAGTGIVDTAGNVISAGFTSGQVYAFDHAAPTASIAVADSSLVVGETSVVTITFSEAVTGLTTADFAVANGVLSGLSSSDGGTSWIATLTPTTSIEDTTNLVTLANTSIQDAAGNTGVGTTNSNNYVIDTLRPTGNLTRLGSANAGNDTMVFELTTSEGVSGIDASDFTLINTGGLTATIGSVQTVDARTYRVTVDNIQGAGTLALRLVNAGGIVDAGGNAFADSITSGTHAIDSIPHVMVDAGVTSLPLPTMPEPSTLNTPFIVLPTVANPAAGSVPDTFVGSLGTPTIDSVLANASFESRTAGDSSTHGSSATRTAVSFSAPYVSSASSSGAPLQALPDLGIRTIEGNRNINVVLPRNTFSVSDRETQIVVTARQASGQPLPAWLKFDASTGTFSGQPPAGWSGRLDIEIVATDAKGNRATSVIHFDVKAARPAGRAGLDTQFRNARLGANEADLQWLRPTDTTVRQSTLPARTRQSA
jgi:trimeric autotransporter adhesin